MAYRNRDWREQLSESLSDRPRLGGLGAALSAGLQLAVRHDAWAVFAFDPYTGIRVDSDGRGGMMSVSTATFVRNELGARDRIRFHNLARQPIPAGILGSDADRDRESFRLHGLMKPAGFASELRVVIRDRATAWGGLVLLRRNDVDAFTEHEAQLCASACSAAVDSLRSVRPRVATVVAPPVGVVLVDGTTNEVRSKNPPAQNWFTRLSDAPHLDSAPRVVHEVAFLAGHRGSHQVVVQGGQGDWISVSGNPIDGDAVAVTISAATVAELFPVFAARCQFSPRERQIARLLLTGAPVKQIARHLDLSTHTVDFHRTHIYDKARVTARDELLAQILA